MRYWLVFVLVLGASCGGGLQDAASSNTAKSAVVERLTNIVRDRMDVAESNDPDGFDGCSVDRETAFNRVWDETNGGKNVVLIKELNAAVACYSEKRGVYSDDNVVNKPLPAIQCYEAVNGCTRQQADGQLYQGRFHGESLLPRKASQRICALCWCK